MPELSSSDDKQAAKVYCTNIEFCPSLSFKIKIFNFNPIFTAKILHFTCKNKFMVLNCNRN